MGKCMLKKLHQHAIHGWEIELARSEKIRDVERVAAVRTERSRVEGHAWWKGRATSRALEFPEKKYSRRYTGTVWEACGPG